MKCNLQTDNTPQTPQQQQQTSFRPKKEKPSTKVSVSLSRSSSGNSVTTLHLSDHSIIPAVKGGFTVEKKIK